MQCFTVLRRVYAHVVLSFFFMLLTQVYLELNPCFTSTQKQVGMFYSLVVEVPSLSCCQFVSSVWSIEKTDVVCFGRQSFIKQ